MLVNVPRLVTAYYTETPDPSVPEQRVAFGTSGHRGSAFETDFNEWHILSISQAVQEELLADIDARLLHLESGESNEFNGQKGCTDCTGGDDSEESEP